MPHSYLRLSSALHSFPDNITIESMYAPDNSRNPQAKPAGSSQRSRVSLTETPTYSTTHSSEALNLQDSTYAQPADDGHQPVLRTQEKQRQWIYEQEFPALLPPATPAQQVSCTAQQQLAAPHSFSEGLQTRPERMLTTSAASPHKSRTPQGALVAGTAQPQQAGHAYSGQIPTGPYPSNNLQGHNFQDTDTWPALSAPSTSQVTTPAVPAQVTTQSPYCPQPEELMAAWPNTDAMSPEWVALIPVLLATLPPEYQSRFWTAMQEGTVHQFRHVSTSSSTTQQHSTHNAAAPGSGDQP
jgi:hypothetical protein